MDAGRNDVNGGCATARDCMSYVVEHSQAKGRRKRRDGVAFAQMVGHDSRDVGRDSIDLGSVGGLAPEQVPCPTRDDAYSGK